MSKNRNRKRDADNARSTIPTLIIHSYKIGSENCGSSSWGQRLGGEGKPAGRMGVSDQFYEKLSLDSLHAILHRTKVLADKAVRPYRSAIRFDVPGSAILDKSSTQQPMSCRLNLSSGGAPRSCATRIHQSFFTCSDCGLRYLPSACWCMNSVADPNDPGIRSSPVYPTHSIKNASDTTTD